MSNTKPITVGMRTFIPIAVDEDSGCDGCDLNHDRTGMCSKLPACTGRNFAVIFKEID